MKAVAIPPIVAGIVVDGISKLDGFLFEEADSCPYCNGELRAHDIKQKKFATIIENGSVRKISVNVKRFRCRDCSRLVYAESPFYEGIRMGAPLVDFCTINLRMHPANHISKILKKMGILVNPSTIRSLSAANHGEIAAIEFHEILFPLSLLNISEAAFNEKGNGNAMLLNLLNIRSNKRF